MEFTYQERFPLADDPTPYQLLSRELVTTCEVSGLRVVLVEPEGLRLLAREAMRQLAFFLRPGHLRQLTAILDDAGATANDRYIAAALLENASVASRQVLPLCQDTGTAVVMAHKGEQVWTRADDTAHLTHGIFDAYTGENLRYSQMAALSMFEEVNTGCNLPASIEIAACPGDEYHFLFLAKGGGSANKTFLFQETKSLLNEKKLLAFCREKVPLLGTAACPPYHLALVVGGLSAEENLKTVKLASAGYYDRLPVAGDPSGRAFRDLEWERRLLEVAQATGLGAQFGGRHLALNARVIRLPRHAASCPVGLGVSCSAHRNLKAKITGHGIFIETLALNPPASPSPLEVLGKSPVTIDLTRPMPEIIRQLTACPVGTLLHLNGPLVVARDLAHARIQAGLSAGLTMPDYLKNHPVYYAGPAKTPPGLVSGSFGPTTAGRMDDYVESFQARGGSLVMLAKGNRSPQVAESCRRHGGFYLGTIGGPAAALAKNSITAVEVIDFPELGMEAVRRIQVRDFPAFVVCDDKGHDLFALIRCQAQDG